MKSGKTENITILFLSDVFGGVGGAERNLFQIATSLNGKGYKTIICALHDPVLLLDKLVKRRDTYFNELETKDLQIMNLNLKRIYSLFGIIKMIKLFFLIKKENVRLLVSYHEAADYVGAILSLFCNIPAISSRRDMGFKLKKRHIAMYKLINPIFERIIAVSNAVKNNIIERELIHPFKITTIYNGTDLDYFSQQVDISEVKSRLKLPLDKPIIGTIANIKKIKGHRFLIEAMPTVLKEFSDAQFIIVGGISGDEEENLKRDLSNLARELKVLNNLHFYESTQRINEIIKTMDIFVLPSLSEGFSNTIIEAMAAEKPVVATNVGGNPEAIEHGKTGLLIPPSDPKALATAILTLLKDKELASRMGREGRKKAEKIFSLDVMIEKTKNIYDEVVQSKANNKKYFKLATIKKYIKLMISTILFKFRLFHLYLFLSNKILPYKSIKILCYHKIENYEDIFNMSVSIRNFEQQLLTLQKFYKIISLQDALDLLKSNSPILYNAIVITFDDGYKSIYTNAYPISKKYGIPFTVFLTGNMVDNKMEIWHDIICATVDKTNKENVIFDNREIYIANQYAKNVFKKYIVEKLKGISVDMKNKLMNDLLLQLNNNRRKKSNNIYLTTEEIIEMGKNGVQFGSHSLNHTILTQMPLESARKEIIYSKAKLEKELKMRIDYFAYPNGNYNEEIKNIVKDEGYSCAVTLESESNNRQNNDLFALKRINITEDMSTNIWGRFSDSLFICEIIGLNKKLLSLLNFYKPTRYYNYRRKRDS